MISSIVWVPAGVADPNPKRYEMSAQEMEIFRLLEEQQQYQAEAMETGERGNDDEEDDEEEELVFDSPPANGDTPVSEEKEGGLGDEDDSDADAAAESNDVEDGGLQKDRDSQGSNHDDE